RILDAIVVAARSRAVDDPRDAIGRALIVAARPHGDLDGVVGDAIGGDARRADIELTAGARPLDALGDDGGNAVTVDVPPRPQMAHEARAVGDIHCLPDLLQRRPQ